MYSVPVVIDYNEPKLVGSISLNNDIEKLLLEGVLFTLGASILTETNNKRKVVRVTLSLIPAKEKDD